MAWGFNWIHATDVRSVAFLFPIRNHRRVPASLQEWDMACGAARFTPCLWREQTKSVCRSVGAFMFLELTAKVRWRMASVSHANGWLAPTGKIPWWQNGRVSVRRVLGSHVSVFRGTTRHARGAIWLKFIGARAARCL